MRRAIVTPLLALGSMLLAACDENPMGVEHSALGAADPSLSVRTGEAYSHIEITTPAGNSQTLSVGGSTQMVATLRFAEGGTLAAVPYAMWRSTDECVATVTSASPSWGLVKGVRSGTTRIVAEAWGKADTVTVTVTGSGDLNPSCGDQQWRWDYEDVSFTGAPADRYAVAPGELLTRLVLFAGPKPDYTIDVGGTHTLRSELWYSGGGRLNGRGYVNFVTTDVGVATIDARGTVTGIAPGRTKVIVRLGTNFADTVPLYVRGPDEDPEAPPAELLVPTTVEVTTAQRELTVGSVVHLTAVVRDQNDQEMGGIPLTWTSSNTSVARVSATGTVTARSAGRARITASADGKSGSVTITVVAPPAPEASAPSMSVYANVGARTAFNRANSLDLAAYCNGRDNEDDSSCIGSWLSDAQEQGKHLYVSPGTYLFEKDRVLFSGAHIRCADPSTTVFKMVNTSDAGNPKFIIHRNFTSESLPFENISIENCGFDLNGAQSNFASVIVINGTDSHRVRNVTIRGNRFFDSTQPGDMYTDRSRQRQYIVVLAAEDVLIENNRLSEGGRIKAGRPGARIVIRGNTLHNINDNGITVVNSGSHTSAHYLIENNTIINALGAGIFFGSDGRAAGTPDQVVEDIIIRNNRISGGQSACIQGTLPNHTRRVYIYNNNCAKVPVRAGYGADADFDSGISLMRANYSTLPVEQVTIFGNTISNTSRGFGNTAIFVRGRFQGACVLSNTFELGGSTAMRLDLGSEGWGKVTANVLNGSRVRVDSGDVDESGSTTGCIRL